MAVALAVRNESGIRGPYRVDDLKRLLGAICRGEHVAGDVEVSLLFSTDAAIRALNLAYAHSDEATDVLSFEQTGVYVEDGPRALGDIVISLETVRARCAGDRDAMRHEVRLLTCHGMLHLLGYDHEDGRGRRSMIAKQATYLGCTRKDAWFSGH